MAPVIWMAAASVLTGLFVGRSARRERRADARPPDVGPVARPESASRDEPSSSLAAPPPPPPESDPSAAIRDVVASGRHHVACRCARPRTETGNAQPDVAGHLFRFACGGSVHRSFPFTRSMSLAFPLSGDPS